MTTICDDFPQFFGWPPRKVYFLENMACEQEGQEEEEDYSYVVIPKERDGSINYVCEICTQRLLMAFNQDEEEWVFNDSKEAKGVVYHYPLCYEVAIGKRG